MGIFGKICESVLSKALRLFDGRVLRLDILDPYTAETTRFGNFFRFTSFDANIVRSNFLCDATILRDGQRFRFIGTPHWLSYVLLVPSALRTQSYIQSAELNGVDVSAVLRSFNRHVLSLTTVQYIYRMVYGTSSQRAKLDIIYVDEQNNIEMSTLYDNDTISILDH